MEGIGPHYAAHRPGPECADSAKARREPIRDCQLDCAARRYCRQPNQQTIEARELSRLPLPGRSMIALATLASGVSCLETMGGRVWGGDRSRGSATDNYWTQTQVDASANGQGTMSNI